MKAPVSTQKLRGGYYTPQLLAEFLARWAVQRAADQVLEPSCGDGAFVEAIARRKSQLGGNGCGEITAVEIDALEAKKAAATLERYAAKGAVLTSDFFRYCDETLLTGGLWESLAPRFDAVVGNPPFIRYQHFPEAHRETAFRLMRSAGLTPNKLTNAWAAFLVCGALALKPDGRLAMVIPAELLQVGYAAEVRRFLSQFFERITIVTFQSLVFPGIQQEVVLLLAERTAHESKGIRTVEFKGLSDLEHFDFFRSLNADVKPLDHNAEKWTKYFLPARDIHLLRRLRGIAGVSRVGDVAEVDVGVVTGENSFFVLKPSEVANLALGRSTKKIVSRSAQLVGLEISVEDWNGLRESDSRILLFSPREPSASGLPKSVAKYISDGEKSGKHEGYKCRIRKTWYAVQSTWTPDAFALRQVHSFPKLVVNEVGATSTDTIHRVRMKTGHQAAALAAAFLNSMTFAFSEVMGRSYGGGVLTFEPSEVEGLPIPLKGSEYLDFAFIDQRLREHDIVGVLDHTDEILLRQHLGLTRSEITQLREAWFRLRDRRIRRRSASTPDIAPANDEHEDSAPREPREHHLAEAY